MKWLLLWIPLALVPAVVSNNVVLTVLIFTFILGILGVSFNLIFGFTGQLSLFHAAPSACRRTRRSSRCSTGASRSGSAWRPGWSS